MEQDFGDAVQRVWDGADVPPEPVISAMQSSEDSGPWPLPLYPALGAPPGLLSSPCWQLPSFFDRDYRFSSGGWSAVEPSSGPPAASSWPGALTTPEAPAEALELAEETTLQQGPVTQAPKDAGDGARDTANTGRAQPAERRPPPGPAAWRRQPLFPGLLQRVAGALSSLSRGCLPTSCDVEEPSDGSGGGPSGDVLG